MTKITVAFLRMVLKQYDNEEISFSKMVEFLNNEANKDNEALKFIKRLREGGEIVSSGSLSTVSIAQAQACDRFFVDEDYFGYAYFPKQKTVNVTATSNSEHLLNIPYVSKSACDHNWNTDGQLGYRCMKCGIHPADQLQAVC